MQSLPAPSSVMEGSPILMGDNVATVLVRAWDLEAAVFDGKKARGPVPIFFSENVNLTKRCLEEDSTNTLIWHARVMHR